MEYWKKNLYILMFCQFLAMVGMTMIIPFIPFYLKTLGMTDPAEINLWSGLIFGINFLSSFVFSPLWGNLADRLGNKLMVLRSGFGMAIMIFLCGLVTTPFQLLLVRFFNGVVSGFTPASSSLVATNTPTDKIGSSLGLLQSSMVAGTVVGPLIGGILAEHIGLKNVFFVTSVVMLVATFFVLFYVKEQKKNYRKSTTKEKKGPTFLNKPLLILFFSALLIQFSVLGPGPQMVLLVNELVKNNIIFWAGIVVGIAGLANMISAPILGKLVDRLGPYKVLYSSLICSSLAYLPHVFVTTPYQLLFFRFLLGLSFGGLMPSIGVLIKQNSPLGKEGLVFGYYNSALSLGNLFGPILLGYSAGLFGIKTIFIISSAVLFLALLNILYFEKRLENQGLKS